MKIQITQSFIEGKGPAFRVYDVLNLPDALAQEWIAKGRAKAYVPDEPLFLKKDVAAEPRRETATRTKREKAIAR